MTAALVVVGVLLWLLGTGLGGYLILAIDRESSSSPALNSERDRRRRASRLIA